MKITIELSAEQVVALQKLDVADKAQEYVEKATATYIKSKFKYYAEGAERETEKAFDFVSNAGVKMDTDKGAFVASYMREIREVLNAL